MRRKSMNGQNKNLKIEVVIENGTAQQKVLNLGSCMEWSKKEQQRKYDGKTNY